MPRGESNEGVRCGGRGFADLSPCVSGRQWIERDLRCVFRPLSSRRYTSGFDQSLSEIPWDGNSRYPHSRGCYGFEPEVSPPVPIPLVGVR